MRKVCITTVNGLGHVISGDAVTKKKFLKILGHATLGCDILILNGAMSRYFVRSRYFKRFCDIQTGHKIE